jgi:tight adherence protein C
LDAFMHAGGLALTFASVSTGAYGLMRQLALLGLWPLRATEGRSLYGEAAHRLGAIAARNGWFPGLREGAQRDLIRSGQPSRSADDVVGESMLQAILGAVVIWVVTLLAGGAPWNVVPAAVAAAILVRVPGWSLRGKGDQRILQITRRLPYSLEVIVLATESGAGFDEALEILVREDPRSPLHEEFDQVLRDARLGQPRREALRTMAARVGTQDMTALVMALEISENLGTPLAEALKKQAESIRLSRIQRAERLAREAGPKMALPNTMIMVANVLLILGPFLPKLSLTSI